MLYFILVWILLGIFCYILGTALLIGLDIENFERVGDRFIVAIWLGIVLFSAILLGVSVFIPLTPITAIGVAISLLGLSLVSRRIRDEVLLFYSELSSENIVIFLVAAILIAAITTQKVTWIDTGLYHFGVIQWLFKFGAVPGIALIHPNLGFTSTWFALAAPFNTPLFGGFRTTALINGFVFLLFILQVLISTQYIYNRKSQLADWFVIAFAAIVLPLFLLSSLFRLMSEILVSASPDLPSIFFVLIIAWSILILSYHGRFSDFKSNTTEKSRSNSKVIPLILATGAFTTKLTSLPLLAVAILFYLVHQKTNVRQVLLGAAIVLALLIPMLIHGTISSGCPLFPSKSICLNLPWTIEEIANVQWGISNFSARDSSKLVTFWKWFTYSGGNTILGFLLISSIGLSLLLVKLLNTEQLLRQSWLFLLSGLGLFLIMSKGPSIRFGLGYAVLIPSLSIANLCYSKLQDLGLRSRTSLKFNLQIPKSSQFASLFIFSSVALILFSQGELRSRLLIPPELPKVETITKQVNDVSYTAPVGDGLCWGAALPCSPVKEFRVQLRDPEQGIKAGFIRSPQ
jgi:hypothetical protein